MQKIINLIKNIKFTKNELLLLVGLWSLVFGFLLFNFLGPNYSQNNSPIRFTIQKGESVNSIVDNLYTRGIIPSKYSMNIAMSIYGAEKEIKAGNYIIPNGLNYFQLVDLLKKGTPGKQILVTIPEGIWQPNLAKLLADKLKIDKNEFLELSKNRSFLNSLNITANNLEGYLLPNTYYFYDGTSVEDVIKKLKSEMDKIFLADSVITQMANLDMTKNEILTLASIIDGESNKASEFKLISSVYHNRLKRRIKLQADPTIQYLKRNKRSKNKVYYKDLEIDSPYNTYKHYGLPPSPINNPGKKAVLAAIFPAKTNYIFFVADGTGGHRFASKLREHNKNVAAYRKWRRSQ